MRDKESKLDAALSLRCLTDTYIPARDFHDTFVEVDIHNTKAGTDGSFFIDADCGCYRVTLTACDHLVFASNG